MVCLGLEPGAAGADESTELRRHLWLSIQARPIVVRWCRTFLGSNPAPAICNATTKGKMLEIGSL